MRFLFVDKVDEVSAAQVRGRIRFHAETPFRRQAPDGSWRVLSGVVGEGMGQLVSWGLMSRQDFRFRPIYLFSERLDTLAFAAPGDEVELVGTIERLTDESVVFSATASVGGREIQRLTRCTNYFMPLEQLEDPAVTRDELARLVSPEGRPLNDRAAGGTPYDFDQHISAIQPGAKAGTMTALARIAPGAGFYADHFPREPITPIVVINEVIDRAAARLFAQAGLPPLVAAHVEGIKIKSFIRPGEEFQVELELGGSPDTSASLQALRVRVSKEGKEILRGRYHFRPA